MQDNNQFLMLKALEQAKKDESLKELLKQEIEYCENPQKVKEETKNVKENKKGGKKQEQ